LFQPTRYCEGSDKGKYQRGCLISRNDCILWYLDGKYETRTGGLVGYEEWKKELKYQNDF